MVMAERAEAAEGKLLAPLFSRIERLAERIDDCLVEAAFPSLLHGELWTGNVLVRGGRIAGFVDPAIYCGHPEIRAGLHHRVRDVRPSLLRGLCGLAAARTRFPRASLRHTIYTRGSCM
jgi:fructosamine-3-kinase